jgi:uncharacterized protein DUF4907
MRKWMVTGILVVLTAGTLFGGYYWRQKWRKDHIMVTLRAIHTEFGWGYDIWTDKTRYIHQDVIPGIPGNFGFRTKEDALAVGQLVYDRLIANQMPIVTTRDLDSLKILPDTTQHFRDSLSHKFDSLHKK